jgi:hypothetical protein
MLPKTCIINSNPDILVDEAPYEYIGIDAEPQLTSAAKREIIYIIAAMQLHNHLLRRIT